MFRALVETGKNLISKGEMIHPGYRVFSDSNPINWILHIGRDGKLISEPEKVELRKPRPTRQRSGRPSPNNLKPYLLVDEARYVLGIPESGKEQEAGLLHSGSIGLLQEAYKSTKASYLAVILEYLQKHMDRTSLALKIEPRDVVTFKVGDIPYPFERREMQEFWADHISEDCRSDFYGQCSVCGQYDSLMQTLPKSVFVLNQSCQITSFNLSAFRSFGRDQTVNASICVGCGLLAAQTLEHLLSSDRHSTILVRDDTRGERSNPLMNQIAVFWLTQDEESFMVDDREISVFDVLTSSLSHQPDIEVATTLELIQHSTKAPWLGKAPAELGSNTFCLAVVSANKARLVIREWIRVPIESSLYNLGRYIQALQIVGPRGEKAKVFPINQIMSALKISSPNILRGLLRTAYVGYHVPPGILEAAVRRMRVVAHQSSARFVKEREYHIIASAAKLAMTYGTKEAETLEKLDITRDNPGYLCGRLLAVLEEIQRRASRFRLNVTLVERFFGAASTSPVTVFPGLLKLAETAYLPKIRKENLGYVKMRTLLQEVCVQLDKQFPSILTLKEQGEFMLGFYHQRASFEAERMKARAMAKQKKQEEF